MPILPEFWKFSQKDSELGANLLYIAKNKNKYKNYTHRKSLPLIPFS